MKIFYFVLDLTQCVTCLYGGFLFSWWWYVLRKASSVYAMVTITFFGFAIQNGVTLYYRHLMAAHALVCDHDEARFFEDALWNFRDIFTFIGLLSVAVAMSIRAAQTISYYRALDLKTKEENDEKESDLVPDPGLSDFGMRKPSDGADPGDVAGPDKGV